MTTALTHPNHSVLRLTAESFGFNGSEKTPAHEILGFLNSEVPVIKKGEEYPNKWGYENFARVLALFNPSGFYFDFDMTLGHTRRLYTKAEQYAVNLLLKELGVGTTYDYSTAKEVHDIFIHESVKGILPGHLRSVGLIKTELGAPLTEEELKLVSRLEIIFRDTMHMLHREFEKFPAVFETPYKKLLAENPDEQILVERIKEALRLSLTVEAFNVPLRILTNSDRERVEMLLPLMGYDTIFSPDPYSMVCFGDKHPLKENGDIDPFRLTLDEESPHGVFEVPSKSTPSYWNHIFSEDDPSRAVMFEDNPHAAHWALSDGVGLVICRNEKSLSHIQDFTELKQQFPHRLLVVSQWSDLNSDPIVKELQEMILNIVTR